MDYKKLQNGSDIRGIAISGVKDEFPNLTKAACEHLTAAFILWLSKKTNKRARDLSVSIGRDSRLSGTPLAETAVNTMRSYGVKVLDCGLSSTPAMFMSTVFPEYRCDGAIMITASHLPYNRNGFKYFDASGGLNKEDVAKIISLAEAAACPEMTEKGEVVHAELMKTYCRFIKDKIKNEVNHALHFDKPLDGLKIIVDAGNGAGGFFAKDILAPLGADIRGSQYLEPDGTFPNHAPNPEDKDAMHSISMAVLATDADLGLIFDTDVDRSAAVDARGREISRNKIVALAAALIAEESPDTTVVTDSVTSDFLTEFLTKTLGLKHLRFKRGYKNVINEAIRLNEAGIDSRLAIETSGHAAYKENYFLDDGAYLAAKIVIKTAKLASCGKTLDSLLSELREPVESREIRLPIKSENFGISVKSESEFADAVLESLKKYAEAQQGMALAEPNYEGVRVNFDKTCGDGWCLLRKSLHDPIMPLNIESNTEGGCETILRLLAPVLKSVT